MIALRGVKNAILKNRKRNYSTKFCKLPPIYCVYEVEQRTKKKIAE